MIRLVVYGLVILCCLQFSVNALPTGRVLNVMKGYLDFPQLTTRVIPSNNAARTITFWAADVGGVNFTSGGIIAFGEQNTTDCTNSGKEFSIVSNVNRTLGLETCTTNSTNGITNQIISPQNVFKSLNWTYIAVSWNTTHLKTYIDGKLQQTVNGNGGQFHTVVSGCINFGRRCSLPSDKFYGYLDEIRIYNRSLTSSEITTDFSTSNPNQISGLKAYWNFNSGLATDLTGNGLNGTLMNNATIVNLSSIPDYFDPIILTCPAPLPLYPYVTCEGDVAVVHNVTGSIDANVTIEAGMTVVFEASHFEINGNVVLQNGSSLLIKEESKLTVNNFDLEGNLTIEFTGNLHVLRNFTADSTTGTWKLIIWKVYSAMFAEDEAITVNGVAFLNDIQLSIDIIGYEKYESFDLKVMAPNAFQGQLNDKIKLNIACPNPGSPTISVSYVFKDITVEFGFYYCYEDNGLKAPGIVGIVVAGLAVIVLIGIFICCKIHRKRAQYQQQ